MEIDLQPGRYVIAVSGGVDSIVLLHALKQLQSRTVDGSYRFTVAHYDHGIREDSIKDRRLVQSLAHTYDLPFVYQTGKLGSKTSEARARRARYDFLHQVRLASKADAIVTAHHQDDVLETVILNLLRGTGRRGLSSLKTTEIIRRPLLRVLKKDILRYAEQQGLIWHEDSTNSDQRYLRNYIRLNILRRFSEQDTQALLAISQRAAYHNPKIETCIANYLHLQPARLLLDRYSFIMLPHIVAREVMAEWLLVNSEIELSKKLLERLVIAAKTGRIGSRVNASKNCWLEIGSNYLALKLPER